HNHPLSLHDALPISLRTAINTLTTRFGTTDMTQWLTPKITVKFDAAASAAEIFYGPTTIEREDRGSFNELIELAPTPVSQIIMRSEEHTSELQSRSD